jgi:hypothetical protein
MIAATPHPAATATGAADHRTVSDGAEVTPSFRRLPFRTSAMLAICSDLDETPDADLYYECMRFLNTTEDTRVGRGVGLEIGNSIYFDAMPDQFGYWTTDDRGREMVRALIHSGHVDCLHSYGDRATTRAHAGRALAELARFDCSLQVWVDHAIAPTNFGADIMHGQGDVRGSAAYHADLTCEFGIKYVWRGRVTSMIGQNVPASLAGLYRPAHPIRSAVTVAKEAAKQTLARTGSAKYGLHAGNAILEPAELRSGQPVYEFLRFNPHWGGVSCGDTAEGLGEVLSERTLSRLGNRMGIGVLYTHLGKTGNRRDPFPGPAREALYRLASSACRGRMLITTTRRLLGYCRALREARIASRPDGDSLRLDIRLDGVEWDAHGPTDADGLTVSVSNPESTRVSVNGHDVPEVVRIPRDATGRGAVALPWRRLRFPSTGGPLR